MKHRCKKAVLLFVCLLLINSLSVQTNAQIMPDANTSGVAASAGVNWIEGTMMRVDSICTTRECKSLSKSIDRLNYQIEKSILKQFQSLEGILTDKKLKKRFEKLDKKYEKLVDKIKDHKLNNITEEKDKITQKRADLIEEAGKKITIERWEEEIKALVDERNALLKEYKALVNKTSFKNNDASDVEPEKSGYLPNGELLAWGIPRVPSIPRPRKKTNTSSNTNTSSAQSKTSDASYNALRSVEENSAKITDTDKNQFLSELNSRAATSN